MRMIKPTIVFISAARVSNSAKRNMELSMELYETLLPFKPEACIGKWGVEEESYMLTLRSDVAHSVRVLELLAKEYDQEAILVLDQTDEVARIHYTDGKQGEELSYSFLTEEPLGNHTVLPDGRYLVAQ